jgi:Arc/MetJ-type ribon-helix-helix transcriptional regulator
MIEEFSIEGLESDVRNSRTTDDIAPRPFLPHHLPDGTPLHLTAGILADLAAIYHDDFTAYVPQRFDEFATMIWMASRPKADRGSGWREPQGQRPPLLSGFAALRATVGRWIDDAFRASESDYIRQLALRLWQHHNEARVTVTDQKKSTETAGTDPPSTTPTASLNTSTPSQEETSSPESAPYGP